MSNTYDLRRINIYCKNHGIRFSVSDKKQINCDIKGELLESNFPNGGFWEHCCNCQTFYVLNINEKLPADCPVCEVKLTRRYLCNVCKVFSAQSEDLPKKDRPAIKLQGFVEPSCPGCQTTTDGLETKKHKCSRKKQVFHTARNQCPFCDRGIDETSDESLSPVEKIKYCPVCGIENVLEASSCSKCSHKFQNIDEPSSPVSSAKDFTTRPVVEDNIFDNSISDSSNIYYEPPQTISQTPASKSKAFVGCLGTFFGLIFITVLLTVLGLTWISNLNANDNTSSAAQNTTLQTNTESSNSKISNFSTSRSNTLETRNTPANSPAFSFIGLKGSLKTNVNFRNAPTPNASASIIGIHYKNTKIEILEVRENIVSKNFPGGTNWYKVKVIFTAECDYSYSPNGFCENDSSPKPLIGWINGENVSFESN